MAVVDELLFLVLLAVAMASGTLIAVWFVIFVYAVFVNVN